MNATDPFTVAIDGPAAAGKGTIAKAVAAHFGFGHLETGLLYRAVGRRVLGGETAEQAAAALCPEDLRQGDLHRPEVALAASKVAAMPAVRAVLVDFQRGFARRPGGAVLDGRDTGTVICPQAEVKFHVTASAAVRAGRRQAELACRGYRLSLAKVLADLRLRDARDAERTIAPMKPAEDATLLDTTVLTVNEATARAIAVVAARHPGEA